MINHAEVHAILSHTVSLRQDIAELANVTWPVIIFEPVAHQLLVNGSSLMPALSDVNATLEQPLLRSELYLRSSDLAYVADYAWSLTAADAWLCGTAAAKAGACTPTALKDVTAYSADDTNGSFAHERWVFPSQASSSRVSRSIGGQLLNAFAFRGCGTAASGDVCPEALTHSYHPVLNLLANVWTLALHNGPTSVYSSYEWTRSFDDNGVDANVATGPPRTADGASAPVQCADPFDPIASDVTPGVADDGTAWNCEHRSALLSVMPKWRREVDASSAAVRFLSGDDVYVAFGRGREMTGEARKYGWVAINKGAAALTGLVLSTGLPTGVYRDMGGSAKGIMDGFDSCNGQSVEVDAKGRVTIDLPPYTAVILSTADATLTPVGVSYGVLWLVVVLWVLVCVVLFCAYNRMWKVTGVEVRLDPGICVCEHNEPPPIPEEPKDRAILMSCLEHVVIPLKIKVVAGGLGNVAEFYTEKLPVKGYFVFPMLEGPDYSAFHRHEWDVVFRKETVEVYAYTAPGSNCTFLGLKHPMFMARTKANIYPDGRAPQHFMEFMSLWNRSVAFCLKTLHEEGKVQLFHSLDYHTALAPIYLEAEGGPMLPVALTLHNALYQGSLLETLDDHSWAKIESILKLPNARFYTEFEGDFNMLHGVVSYMKRHQRGEGVVGVSHEYGAQVALEIPLFKGVFVGGHPNPMLETRRPPLPGGKANLVAYKEECKAKVQEHLGFDLDPDAVLFSFVGRWTHEKGLDLLADTIPILLDRHPKMQIYLVGPIGDAVGQYAATKLVALAQVPGLKNRLFVKAEFFRVTPEMRFGADYTICPSRTEPFGYVDVEYAWHGTPTIGSMVGGLGKVPGIYYRVLDDSCGRTRWTR